MSADTSNIHVSSLYQCFEPNCDSVESFKLDTLYQKDGTSCILIYIRKRNVKLSKDIYFIRLRYLNHTYSKSTTFLEDGLKQLLVRNWSLLPIDTRDIDVTSFYQCFHPCPFDKKVRYF